MFCYAFPDSSYFIDYKILAFYDSKLFSFIYISFEKLNFLLFFVLILCIAVFDLF